MVHRVLGSCERCLSPSERSAERLIDERSSERVATLCYYNTDFLLCADSLLLCVRTLCCAFLYSGTHRQEVCYTTRKTADALEGTSRYNSSFLITLKNAFDVLLRFNGGFETLITFVKIYSLQIFLVFNIQFAFYI